MTWVISPTSRPGGILETGLFIYDKRKTILTLWYTKETWTHAHGYFTYQQTRRIAGSDQKREDNDIGNT